MKILSFDPGANTGWALWSAAGLLAACGLVDRSKAAIDFGDLPDPATAGIEAVYSERPKHYPNSKVPVRDLITLALRAGEVAGPYALRGVPVTYYEPWEWKGSIDKDVHQPRLWGALTEPERDLVATRLEGIAPSKRNNVMDGIGIGLFALGRVSSSGVPTRRPAAA